MRAWRRAAAWGALLGSGATAGQALAAGYALKEQSATALGNAFAGATALKTEPEHKLSPAEKLERLPWAQPEEHVEAKADPRALATERRKEAKAKGYEGEMCGECLNFTLVRNGTCMKCDTCGSTTGCS